MPGFSEGFLHGAQAISQQQSRRDANLTKIREFYGKLTDQLSEAMLEPDASIRKTAIEALFRGAEQVRGKPISKEFQSWIVKQPDQALQVLDGIQKSGVDPQVFLQISDDPMLFAHGLLALGKANKERQTRGYRGDGGDASQPAAGAPTGQTPGGSGLDLGGVKQSQPFGAAPSPGAGSQVATPEASAAPQGDEYTQGLNMQVQALQKRINGLANLGSDEKNIAPLRQEMSTLQAELRAPGLAARTETAKLGVQPVTTEDIQRGVAAAQRAGQPDLAPRFVPGMRREAYDALMAKLGTTQSTPAGGAPTSTAASPMQAGPEQLSGPPEVPAVGARGPGLVPTKEEELATQERIKREQSPLSTDLLRDPNVGGRGLRTTGAFEASGATPSSAASLARSSTLATKGAESTVLDFETVKKDGMSARMQQRYLDLLGGAAEHAGPRGPWLTPIRDTLNSFANLLGIEDPGSQSKLQLMNAVTPKLAVLLTQQMKGQQSDREFLAALSTAPSSSNTEKGFAVLVYTAREINKITLAADLSARQWVGKYGSLDTPNAQGKAFQEDFDEALLNFERTNGNLQERVARAFKVKPSQLLKMR